MSDWIRLMGGAMYLAGAVVFLVAALRIRGPVRRVRQLVRHLRYVEAPRHAQAGDLATSKALRDFADVLDGVLTGRL